MAKAFSLLSAGIAAALAVAGLAQAQPQSSAYERFDASAAASPAERLVLCDTAAFLAQRPDLNSDRIVLRRPDRIPVILLPPQFVSNGFIYSDGYERVFNKLRSQGQASVHDVAAAQAGPGRAMVQIYHDTHWVDRAFTARQDRYCRGFAATYGVRAF